MFAAVDEGISMAAEAVAEATSERTRAVIVVHQWGVPASTRTIRELVGSGVSLIEDAAQFWDPDLPGRCGVGQASDVVATSFGLTRPFAVGWGGAACADSPQLGLVVGREVSEGEARSMRRPIAPCAVPDFPMSALRAAADRADRAVAARRAFVAAARPWFERIGARVFGPSDPYDAAWQRIPFLGPEKWELERMCDAAMAHDLVLHTPYEAPLSALPMFRGLRFPLSSRFQRFRSRLLLMQPPLEEEGLDQMKAWIAELHL